MHCGKAYDTVKAFNQHRRHCSKKRPQAGPLLATTDTGSSEHSSRLKHARIAPPEERQIGPDKDDPDNCNSAGLDISPHEVSCQMSFHIQVTN
jgi:hypothetical protein